MGLPHDSVSERVRTGEFCNGPEEINADIWFSDWDRGCVLLEEAVHLEQWDQTLTFYSWFEDEEVPPLRRTGQTEEDDDWEAKELDGNLPWPGKKRRK